MARKFIIVVSVREGPERRARLLRNKKRRHGVWHKSHLIGRPRIVEIKVNNIHVHDRGSHERHLLCSRRSRRHVSGLVLFVRFRHYPGLWLWLRLYKQNKKGNDLWGSKWRRKRERERVGSRVIKFCKVWSDSINFLYSPFFMDGILIQQLTLVAIQD